MDSVSIFCFLSYAICGHPKIFSTEIKVPFGSDANLACMSNFRSEINNQERGRRQGVSSPKRIYGTFHGSHTIRGEFYATLLRLYNSEDDPTRIEEVIDIGAGDDSVSELGEILIS
ncbi:hypothetical protein VPH35_053532 [Triticum aestivum]